MQLRSLHKDFSRVFTNPPRSLLSGRTHDHGRHNEQCSCFLETKSKFDGEKADDFLEWSSKLRASLSIYNGAIFNIPQGQERTPEADDSQATGRAVWGADKEDLFKILLLSTGGSAFFVVRRFEDTTIKDRARHGQQAWAALREKFKGSWCESIRAEHSKMNNTRMRSAQDQDEYLYVIDSGRDRLNACEPPEGPTDRQYEDIYT